ncbi:MAG TPA: DUF4186 family protein [Methylophilaceae bacterium]|nr:DUF4186 family protein [Methylophilaceae bacterium]
MRSIEEVLAALQNSSFRRGFKLRGKDLTYLRQKGLAVILEHARDFLAKRLQPAVFPTMANKRLSAVIPYSLPNMQRHAAVGTVWRNGIAYHEGAS